MKNSGSTSNNFEPPKGRNFFKKLLLGILVVAAIAGLFYIIFEEIVERIPSANTVQVKDIFVDVNGDGLIDFIIKGDVVINTGNNLNLPTSP